MYIKLNKFKIFIQAFNANIDAEINQPLIIVKQQLSNSSSALNATYTVENNKDEDNYINSNFNFLNNNNDESLIKKSQDTNTSQKDETSEQIVNLEEANSIKHINSIEKDVQFTKYNAIIQNNKSGVIGVKSEKSTIFEKPSSKSSDKDDASDIENCDNSLNTQREDEDEFSLNESNLEKTFGDSEDENGENNFQVNFISSFFSTFNSKALFIFIA
jgi:hypothetical protein